MKPLLFVAVAVSFVAWLKWQAFKRLLSSDDAWAENALAASIRSATPARWPEVKL